MLLTHTVSDIVEVGHTEFTGGSVTISVVAFREYDTIETKDILNMIDRLDHSLILASGDDEKLIEFSDRFWHLEHSLGLYHDIAFLIREFLVEKNIKFKRIIISLGKNKMEFNSEPMLNKIINRGQYDY
jgi:hypothetical protein